MPKQSNAPKASTDVSLPIVLSTQEIPENLLDVPAPSPLLQSAIERQEQELANLQTAIDHMNDEFADRAASIVRRGIEQAYEKARSRILVIEVPDFFGSQVPALAPSIEGTTEC